MTTPARRSPTGPLQTLLTLGVVGEETDARLLDIYRNRRAGAEEAFRLLVERHGPMVLAVCRSLVADPAEADDAFQAAFLVLVRRACSIRKGDSLGPWLHGVAVRVAKAARRRSRTQTARLRLLAPAALDGNAGRAPSKPDASALIHAEIDRLPERERQPLVLCRLEGLTYEQAAQALGVSEPTLRGRLHRGRKRLEGRLKTQGVVPPDSMTPIPLPFALANAVQSLTTGAGSTISASHLAKGAILAMTLSSLKPVVFSSLATLGVVGSVVFAQSGSGSKPQAQGKAPAQETARSPEVIRKEVEATRQELQKASKYPSITDKSTREALSRLRDFDVPEKIELQDLLKLLKSRTVTDQFPGLPIYIEPKGLGEANQTMTAQIERPSGFTVGQVLESALEQVDLDYLVYDGFVFISTPTRVAHRRLRGLEQQMERLSTLEPRMQALERKLDGVIQRLGSQAPPPSDIVTTLEEKPGQPDPGARQGPETGTPR